MEGSALPRRTAKVKRSRVLTLAKRKAKLGAVKKIKKSHPPNSGKRGDLFKGTLGS